MSTNKIDVICAIPVHFDGRVRTIAAARGVLWWKRVVVGRVYFALSLRERQAVLYHEARHCLAWHMEKRLLLIPIFWTALAARIVRRQELDADRFAAAHGYGIEMMRVIRRFFAGDGEFYPTIDERCENLSRALRESLHVHLAA